MTIENSTWWYQTIKTGTALVFLWEYIPIIFKNQIIYNSTVEREDIAPLFSKTTHHCNQF